MSRPPASPHRRLLGLGLLSGLGLGITACAIRPPQAPARARSWEGRLALTLDTQPPEQFFAGFRLQGHASNGDLELFTPLGSMLAKVQWQPGSALLQQGQQARHYASLDDLLLQITGAAIPVRALFSWLDGVDESIDGWHTDLARVAEGRLEARRTQPGPAAVLKLIFEPS